MGCCTSRHFVVNPAIKGQDAVAAEVFKRLNLQGTDLDKLYSAFCDIDVDDSGFVQKVEFYAYFKINASALYDKIFGMFDADGSGYLSFMEFVCAMWNFCSMAPENLGSFAFYLFDDDKSGVLDFKEIRRLIEVIHRKTVEENPEIYNLVEKIKETYTVMKVEDFNKCISEKPTLVSPLLAMQFTLRRMLIGESYWKRIAAVRALVPEQVQQEFIMTVEDDAQRILNKQKFNRDMEKRKADQENQIDRINKRQAGKSDMDKARTDHLLDFYSLSEKDKKKRDTTVMSKPKFSTNAYMETGPPEEEEPQKKKKKKKSPTSAETSLENNRPSRLTIDKSGDELAPLKVRSKTISPTYSNVSDTSAASGSGKRHSRKTIVPTTQDETKEEVPKRTSSRKTLIEKSASTGTSERGSRKTLVQKSPSSATEMNSAEQRRAARKTFIAKTASADATADRPSRNTISHTEDPDTILLPKHHRRDDQVVVSSDKKRRKSQKHPSAARELPPVIASKKFQED